MTNSKRAGMWKPIRTEGEVDGRKCYVWLVGRTVDGALEYAMKNERRRMVYARSEQAEWGAAELNRTVSA